MLRFKKTVSLILALAMLASLMVVPSLATVVGDVAADGATSFEHGITYTDPGQSYHLSGSVTPDAVPDDAATVAAGDFYIDLAAETIKIPEGFTVAAYSLDGGTKWVGKALDVSKFSKLLNKEMTLVLSSQKLDKATKKPIVGVEGKNAEGENPAVTAVPGATLVTFPEIDARPKDTKMAVNYGLYPADFGEEGQWIIAEKSATALPAETTLSALQIAVAGSDKKTPLIVENNTDMEAAAGWGSFPANAGINVKPLPESGKPEKTVYLIRSAPVAVPAGKSVPASKGYKVTASSQIKAPSLKADYKKEIIKPKADIQIAQVEPPANAAGDGKYTAEEIADFSAVDNTAFDATNNADGIATYAKGDAAIKTGYDISKLLAETETAVLVQQKGTDKKPASGVQTIILAPRAKLTDAAIAPTKGKIKLPKGFEVFNSEKGKYGGLPKITSTSTTGIPGYRVKSTAKATKEGYSGNAASKDGVLYYDWGDLGEKKPKDGVLSANVIGPNYKDGIIDLYVVSNTGIDDSGKLEVVFAVKGVPEGSLVDDNSNTVTLKDFFKAAIDSNTATTITDEASKATAHQFTSDTLGDPNEKLPAIKVSFEGSGGSGTKDEAVPGKLKVEGESIVDATASITKVNAAEIEVDLNDDAKLAEAETQVSELTWNNATTDDVSDATKAKAAIEAKLKTLTTLPAGVTLEVGTPTGDASDGWTAEVTIKCGTATLGTSVTLTTAS